VEPPTILDQAHGRDPDGAGAASAIGTRWPVGDDAAAVIAYVLHHELARGVPPAEALRNAQLWMIDPTRQPLPGLPEQLSTELSPGHFTEPPSWTAYTYHGA
jgi:CHAT domain-containing protein